MTILRHDYPILEFDSSRKAILSPAPDVNPAGLNRIVLCFFYDILAKLQGEGRLLPLGNLISEIGLNPLYRLEYNGQSVLVLHPGVGAPLAAAFLDEIISLGVKIILACGGVGVLNPAIDAGHPLIIDSAVRDEGTSYHYLPPGREATAHPDVILALEETFTLHHLPIRKVKSWTTDAIYRETAEKRALRMAEGCKVVEMEASALFAVAHFHGAKLGQIAYGGDLVVPEGWDPRDWNGRTSAREMLFGLAVEAVLKVNPN